MFAEARVGGNNAVASPVCRQSLRAAWACTAGCLDGGRLPERPVKRPPPSRAMDEKGDAHEHCDGGSGRPRAAEVSGREASDRVRSRFGSAGRRMRRPMPGHVRNRGPSPGDAARDRDVRMGRPNRMEGGIDELGCADGPHGREARGPLQAMGARRQADEAVGA